MRARVAKKVLREWAWYWPVESHRLSTWHEAARVNLRAWHRVKILNHEWRGTPGYRWGRWDPHQPMPPWEPPF